MCERAALKAATELYHSPRTPLARGGGALDSPARAPPLKSRRLKSRRLYYGQSNGHVKCLTLYNAKCNDYAAVRDAGILGVGIA